VAAATARLADASAVGDAPTAAANPVAAVHARGDGGVVEGPAGNVRAAGARFEVETEPAPVGAGVRAVPEHAGVDPWSAFDAGALLLPVDPSGVEEGVAALDREGIPAAEAGRVVEGTGLVSTARRRRPPARTPAGSRRNATDGRSARSTWQRPPRSTSHRRGPRPAVAYSSRL
jgi:hydrogenase maturation factor